jgi:hypothetical protein
MAVGAASRRLGDYVKSLAMKYLMLSAAGTIFLIAIIFGILAVFWALTSSIHNPVISAAIMAGALALIGFLTVLIAYGITGRKRPGAKQALREPLQAVQGEVPSVDDVGRRIEHAVRQYGPMRVTAAAAAGGLAAGILARRFGQLPSYRPARLEQSPAHQRTRRHRRLRDRAAPRTRW